MCCGLHTMPELLLASEYAKPSTLPAVRPKMPYRFGPCLALPPLLMVWHCAHFDLNSFAPFLASPAGTSTWGSAMTIAAEAGKSVRADGASRRDQSALSSW